MQVSHVKDHVTHAVIGGGQTIDFGISDSAEFFNILSSTLYKDQKLAVARETLCNAWDAHIEAKRTHIPVEITLTEDTLTIRDFGTGIHHDDMGPIYGTYGNSTKKNDGKQTGGFGLGCKAPFAYTDHFEVQSFHEGVRTIYNLSKSSATAMGKPGIVPIAAFDTTETGLQVSMHINNRHDRDRFELLIKRIAANGDMNMTLNGELIEKLGFDTVETNYLITKDNSLLDNVTTIMVRYGNVIYPVELTAEIRRQHQTIQAHLESLSSYRSNDKYRIIFQAPPNSISVQPSREGLSMQEHTVATLTRLFTGFLKTIETKFPHECDAFATESVNKAVTEVMVGPLLNGKEELPIKPADTEQTTITDLASMAKRYMIRNYPSSLAFRKRDIVHRVRSMADAGLIGRGISQTFVRSINKVSERPGMGFSRNAWLQRRVVAPLLVKLNAAGVDHARLYVFDPEDPSAPKSYYNKDTPPLVRADNAHPKHMFHTLPYLRNIVVLATSKAEIAVRAYKFPTFKELGQYPGFLFYQVSMKKAEREAAIAFFNASGMNVVDMTMRQDWEPEEAKPAVKPPKKPKKEGLPLLSEIGKGHYFNTRVALSESVKRIDKPEFIVCQTMGQKDITNALGRWDSAESKMLVEMFGSVGAITNNSLTDQKWRKELGIPDFDTYVRTKITNFLLNDPTVQEYWAFNPHRVMDNAGISRYDDGREFIKVVYRSPELRKQFGLVNNMTPEGMKYVHLWKKLLDTFRYQHNLPDDIAKAKIHLEAIPLDPANDDLIKKIKNNKVLGIINETALAKMVKSGNPAQIKSANDILKLALN